MSRPLRLLGKSSRSGRQALDLQALLPEPPERLVDVGLERLDLRQRPGRRVAALQRQREVCEIGPLADQHVRAVEQRGQQGAGLLHREGTVHRHRTYCATGAGSLRCRWSRSSPRRRRTTPTTSTRCGDRSRRRRCRGRGSGSGWCRRTVPHRGCARGWPPDPRVRYDALGVQAGGPAARNAALLRPQGDVVAGSTATTSTPTGGLAALVAALDGDPRRGLGLRALRLAQPRRRRLGQAGRAGTGAGRRRRVAARFVATDDFPFPAAFAAYRRPHLVAHVAGRRSCAPRTPCCWLRSHALGRRLGRPRGRDPTGAGARQATVRPADIALRDLPQRAWRDRAAPRGRAGARGWRAVRPGP